MRINFTVYGSTDKELREQATRYIEAFSPTNLKGWSFDISASPCLETGLGDPEAITWEGHVEAFDAW